MSGVISDNLGRASGLLKAAGGGGKLLQFFKTTDNVNRSQTGNYSFTEMSNTLGIDITPTVVGSTIVAITSAIHWYTYGPGNIAIFADSTNLFENEFTGSEYPGSPLRGALAGSFTTTGTSEIAMTVQTDNGGNSAGSGGFSFADATACFMVMEISA